MAIQTDKSLVVLVGDGVNITWDFDFKIWIKDDLTLLYTSADGTVTDKPIDPSKWSLRLFTDTVGGRVTYPVSGAPLESGAKLSILRDMDFYQLKDFQPGQGFDPDSVEDMGDRNTAYCQQLKEELKRAVKVSTTSSETADALIARIEALAKSATTDADRIDKALANLFKDTQVFTTVAGQTGYPITLDGANPNLKNVSVFLGPNFQTPGSAYTLSSDGKTLKFSADPGAGLECTVTVSLSLDNPDLQGAIAAYLAKAEQDLETYSDTNIEPQLDAKVAEATKQADRAAGSALGVGASMYMETIQAGWLHRNGGIFNRSFAPDLWQHAQDANMVLTDTEWLAKAAEQGGTCSYYSSGDGSTTFRIPRDQHPIAPYIDGVVGSKGGFGRAALPEISGQFASVYPQFISDAFESGAGAAILAAGGDAQVSLTSFKASNSNDIYGASNTVHTNRSFMLFCVKAYDNVVPASTADTASMVTSIQENQNNILALGSKIGSPNYGAKTALPDTVNLVQSASKDGYIYAAAFGTSYLQLAITNASGDIVFNHAIIVGEASTGSQSTMIPVKKGTYFKVTALAGTTALVFTPTF